MAVVSNSSPLIALARIQRLDLLPAIFESILIPPAVAREIAPSIPVLPTWLRIQAPNVAPPASLLRFPEAAAFIRKLMIDRGKNPDLYSKAGAKQTAAR